MIEVRPGVIRRGTTSLWMNTVELSPATEMKERAIWYPYVLDRGEMCGQRSSISVDLVGVYKKPTPASIVLHWGSKRSRLDTEVSTQEVPF
ncbi:hypothetical protein Nepgr_014383 [Nepenthes gracilis]|uniref:Uncharacterized protein n=1 Tax=Nepenthes gracilis TaxID=150966 RepID=A0AAD3SL32_NEPGR|nr:hypothetical protein Nepgr_014383 [Nepenthes gracilis]